MIHTSQSPHSGHLHPFWASYFKQSGPKVRAGPLISESETWLSPLQYCIISREQLKPYWASFSPAAKYGQKWHFLTGSCEFAIKGHVKALRTVLGWQGAPNKALSSNASLKELVQIYQVNLCSLKIKRSKYSILLCDKIYEWLGSKPDPLL